MACGFRQFSSLVGALVVFLTAAATARAATITVNSTGDSGAFNQCLSKTDPCTLRGAIAKANASAGDDTIRFSTGTGDAGCDSDGNCVFNLASALPTVTGNLSIEGSGPTRVIVRRSSDAGTPNFGILAIDPGLTVAISGLTLTNGRGNGVAGAIANRASDLTIRNCWVTANVSNYGGAISNVGGTNNGENAKLTMLNSLVIGNVAQAFNQFEQVEAAGVVNFAGGGNATFAATNCAFLNNQGVNGGAIGNAPFAGSGSGVAILTISECTFTSNSSASGGAIQNRANPGPPLQVTADIRNSTFNNNQSTGQGGALYNTGSNVVLVNCTLSANSGTQGGGVSNFSSKVTLGNCTFSANVASDNNGGQSLRNFNGTVEVVNTIFDRTVSAPNISNDVSGGGNFFSFGHNLIDDAAGGSPFGTGPDGLFNASGDMRNTDAALAALAFNGGPTHTHAISGKSDAINHGDDHYAPTLDQRGFVRSGVSDTGAFEAGGQAPSSLANLSTRLPVGSGDNALIAGFIVTGTQGKKLIVRGIGPSLAFPGKLQNPTLELRDPGANLLSANDDWVSSTNKQAIIDSGVAPSNDLESAIVATLPAENSGYTAVLRGVNDGTGIGVLEVYDLDLSANSRLANISTRGLVGTGDNVLFAGTIVLGQPTQKVIVRAIGPSLPLAGAMADPTLELRDGNGTIIRENDNWRVGGQEAEIMASTVAPSHDKESAIVADLPANGAGYTAIVRGVASTTGIAVVEIYRLQ